MNTGYLFDMKRCLLSLFAAFCLSVFPLPDMLQSARPEFLAITILYWVMVAPHHVAVGWAWLLALFLDGLSNSLLGEQALAMAVIAYVMVKINQRMLFFPVWQQAGFIAVLIGLYEFLRFWIHSLAGISAPTSHYLIPILTSSLCWPLWVLMLRVKTHEWL